MFGFLKKKIGDVVNKFSKKVEEEAEIIEEPVEESIKESIKESVEKPLDEVEEKPKKTIKESEKKEKTEEKSKEAEKESEKKIKKEHIEEPELKEEQKIKEKIIEEPVEEPVEKPIEEPVKKESQLESESEKEIQEPLDEVEKEKPKRGFFSKISDTFTKIKLSDEKFEELFWDLEIALLENNVAMEVIQKIKDDLKEELTQEKISRKKSQDIILDSLKKSVQEILTIEKLDFLKKIETKKPFVIAVIGVNGSGKTTTIAKLCHYLKEKGKTVVLAAADTFRAAAIQQIEHHAQNLDIKLIKHDYNSDPSAVAFDAIKHAESKGLDVVIIDTAGRLHSNDDLMNELKKLVRVNKPDLKIFVGESITGNDCVEQAKKYDEIIGIDGIILSKADIDEKGGAALSISYVTKKPVIFIGTGQEYKDLEVYDEQKIIDNLGI